MDAREEFLASCASDGLVALIGLFSREHDDCIQLNHPARPVVAVAISPDFYRLQQHKQLLYADSTRLMHVIFRKGMFACFL